jgi:hypothetical protein
MTTPIYGLPPGVDAQQFQQFQAWMAMQQQQQLMQQSMGNASMQTYMPQQQMTSQQGHIPQQISQPNMAQAMTQPGMQQGTVPQQQQQMFTNQMMATQPVGMLQQQMPYATYQQMPMAQFGTMPPQMMQGYVQPGQFMPGFGQVANFQQAQPSSNIPKAMFDILNWITTVTTDWERKVFQDKKMKPDQVMQTMFDLKDKWNAYFAEFKKKKELGADPEFKALLDAAAEKTVLLIERLRARKKKLQPFMNSTRLKELSLDIDRMVDYDANKRAKIVNDINIRLEDRSEVFKKNEDRTIL